MQKQYNAYSMFTYDSAVMPVWVSSETESLLQDEMPHRKSGVYCRNVHCTQPVVFFQETKQRKRGLKEKVRRKDRRRAGQRVVNRWEYFSWISGSDSVCVCLSYSISACISHMCDLLANAFLGIRRSQWYHPRKSVKT